MDITLIIILIVIAVLAVIGAYVAGRIQLDKHNTSIYKRKLKAEAEYDARIMMAAKTFQVGQFAYITRGVNHDGTILYDVRMVREVTQSTMSAEVPPIDADLHRLAVAWVMASIRADAGQGGGNQLLTEKAAREVGLFSDPAKWVGVGDYLSDRFGVLKVSDRGSRNGTWTRSGSSLNDLLLALSVAGLPPAPARETLPAKSA